MEFKTTALQSKDEKIAPPDIEESKAVSILATKHFKFPGFCLDKNGSGICIRAHRKSHIRAKRKYRELTRRSQGRNLRKLGVPAAKAFQWGNTRLGY